MALLAIFVGICSVQAAEPQLAATIAGMKGGYAAIDKDNNPYPIAYEMESESVATNSTIYKRHFVIYNRDLSVMKEFSLTITDIEGSDWNMWYPTVTTYSSFGLLYDTADYAIATQHLFNADDKWEVVLCKHYNGNKTYLVYNEDGELVCDLGQFMTHDSRESFQIYYVGNGLFYLVVNHNDCKDNDGRDFNYCDFYSFTSEASGISIPKTVRRVSLAHPNPLPAGQTLTIDLANPASRDCKISIVDITGRVVLHQTVDEGTTSVTIPSHRVRNGNFVYMVTENGTIVDTGKVIAQ